MPQGPAELGWSPERWFRDAPIRSKLLLAYSTLFTVAIVLSSLVVSTFVRRTIEANTRSELTNSTAILVQMVKSTADASVRNYLRAVAEKDREIVSSLHERSVRGEMTEAAARRMAERILLSQTIGRTGYVYCLDSRGLLSVHPKLKGRDISSYGFVKEQVGRREGYLEYEWKNPGDAGERPKALYMTYFEPWDWIISASSYRSEFSSLVNLEDFRAGIGGVRFGKTGYPYVMDTQGNLLIHPQLQGTNIRDARDSSSRLFIQEIIARRSGDIIYDWRNPGEQGARKKLVIFDYIPELDWIVASSSYLDEFYGPLHTIEAIILCTVLVSWLLILCLTRWLGGTITRPLNELVQHLATSAGGNLAVRMPVGSRDETGQLARYFNDFMEKLESYNRSLQAEIGVRERAEADLQEHQQHLADMVRQRTHDLEEARRYFESILVHSPVAIVVADPSRRVTTWNPAAEKLFGFSQSEALGADIDLLVAQVDAPPDAARFRESPSFHLATRRSRRDGTTVEVDLRGVPIMLEGRSIAWLAIYYDITELQQARAAAEAAVQAKSEFLANMSHEIRTPLNGVIGMTSLLLDTPLDAEQQEYAETIRRSGEALLSIINDILDFSKIEAGKLELEAHPFEVRECVESAVDLVAYRAAEKDLELLCNIAPDVPVAVLGDETRLRQILVNLLGNAVKFTEAGEVEVALSLEPPPAADTNGMQLHVSVRDTGLGLPPHRVDRLFQAFSQVDATTTRRFGGTGLGLAISKRLAELMGGRIWVESTGVPGQGATFHVSLPVRPTDVDMNHGRSLPCASVQGRTLLVVDDNATNRLIVARMARGWGLEAVGCSSGQEALDRIDAGVPVDVVLVDAHLPLMDGDTVAAVIRRRGGPTLPVLMMGRLGHKPSPLADQAMTAYLHKPVKAAHLYDALVAVFAGEQQAQSQSSAPEGGEFDPHMGRRHPLRILLAEDNLVNQRVVSLILERMGYRADVAGNGIEALQALERQDYDVVLMDVQMPEMSGIEATRRLRADLPPSRMPRIIALTANALGGDREQLLAAGMDGYLSKPLRVPDMRAALEACTPVGRRASVSAPPPPRVEEEVTESGGPPHQDASGPAIDLTTLRGFLPFEGTCPALLARLATEYLADTRERLSALRQEAAEGSLEAAGRSAHALKGASLTFGARTFSNLCRELEALSLVHAPDRVVAVVATMDLEFERVRIELEHFVEQLDS